MIRIFGLASVVAVSTAFSSGVATAALIAYDPFLSGPNRAAGEYTAGTSIGVVTQGAFALGFVDNLPADVPANGPTKAFSGNTSNYQGNATGENSTAVTYEAGGRVQWIGASGNPFTRGQNRDLKPYTGGTEFWTSIMVNRLDWTAAQNTFVAGGFVETTMNNGLAIGYDNSGLPGGGTAGTPDLIFRALGANYVLLADAPANDNQFVVMQLLVNTTPGSNDTVNIWVDPPSATLGAPTTTFTTLNISDSMNPFGRFRFASTGAAGVAFFDEIRLGTTAADLGVIAPEIPEPCGLFSAALALAGLFCLRRRGC